MNARARRHQSIASAITLGLGFILIGAPIYLLVITSFKELVESQQLSFALPSALAIWQNYSAVFVEGRYLEGLVNSVLVTAPSIVVSIILGSAAAWVFARSSRRWSKIAYYFAISGILLPPAIITTILVLRQIGLLNTQIGLIGLYVGFSFPITVFLITGFIKTIPVELEEAARIDGASNLRMFWSVLLPLLRPVIWTTSILLALSLWNDFFYAFFILGGPEQSTLPLNLYDVATVTIYRKTWNLIFASIVLTSLPLIVLFLTAQRRIISGITSGAVK